MASTNPSTETAHRRLSGFAHFVCAFASVVTTGMAQEPSGAAPPFSATLRALTEAESPTLRGEAALALAIQGDPDDLERIRSVARESSDAAAVPATVGLGLLGVDGVEYTLGEILQQRGKRHAPRRSAAAFAFALLDSDHPAPVLDEFLGTMESSSYRRRHDELVSWLTALVIAEQPSRRPHVEFLIDDEANHDDTVRLTAIRALTRFDDERVDRLATELLESDLADARLLGVELTEPSRLSDKDVVATTVRLAKRDPDPRVRARALDRLTEARVFAALQLAEDAIESKRAIERAAGVRSLLALGGHVIRRALGDKILNEVDPTLRTAMLDAWTGKVPPEMTERLLREIHSRAPASFVRAAARALASSDDPRVAPTLLEAVRRSERDSLLGEVVEAVHGSSRRERLDILDGLSASGALSRAERIAARARFDAIGAAEELSKAIADGELSTDERVACIRAWRMAKMPAPPPTTWSVLPDALGALFR